MAEVREERMSEIWSTENGAMVCVSIGCMGARMFYEIANNKKKTTRNGGYKLDDHERAYMKNFMITECGEPKPTCDCKRLEL
jgi:hypothetical protein